MRLLASLFGGERVVPHLKVRTVVGEAWRTRDDIDLGVDLEQWTANNRCLFTVVDDADAPKLVVDLAPIGEGTVDLEALDRTRILKALCEMTNLIFITFSESEINEAATAKDLTDFRIFMEAKLEEQAG